MTESRVGKSRGPLANSCPQTTPQPHHSRGSTGNALYLLLSVRSDGWPRFAVGLGYRDGPTQPCKEQSCLLGPGLFTAFLDTARCNRALGIFFGIVLSDCPNWVRGS